MVADIWNFGIVCCVSTWPLLGDNGGAAAPCKSDHEWVSSGPQSFGIDQPRVRVKDLRDDYLDLLINLNE